MHSKHTLNRILAFCLLVAMVLSLIASAGAISWDGDGNSGGSASQDGQGSYVLPFGTADECLVGYRFSGILANGEYSNKKVEQSVFDVWINKRNTIGYYDILERVMPKYPKYDYVKDFEKNLKQGTANCTLAVSTSMETAQCYKETELGFFTKLPSTPSKMAQWQSTTENINVIARMLGFQNGTASMALGDKIIVEPIYFISIEWTPVAMTPTEMAIYGGQTFGYSRNGSNVPGWSFISRFTNQIFPNALYTPDGMGLWDKATAISAGTYKTFQDLVTKGYGAAIAFTKKAPPLPDLAVTKIAFVDSNGVEYSERALPINKTIYVLITFRNNGTVAAKSSIYYQKNSSSVAPALTAMNHVIDLLPGGKKDRADYMQTPSLASGLQRRGLKYAVRRILAILQTEASWRHRS